jgi:hypothetical protein
MAVVSEQGVTYEGDQLVLELEDKDLVLQALQSWFHLAPTVLDSSPELGLAQVELPGLAAAVAQYQQDTTAITPPATDQGQQRTPLDYVLAELRARFHRDCHDWSPTLGKNRILDRVRGWPYLKGAVGDPKLSTASEVPIPPRTHPGGPRVGILDTRIYAHPALGGRYLGNPVAMDIPITSPAGGHATFIAGLIALRAPQAELVVDDVLSQDGDTAHSWDVAKKMIGFRAAGVAVLNLSFGCATHDNVVPFVLRRAVERLSPDIVLVAAAGNHGDPNSEPVTGVEPNAPMWPAALDDVVAVGALDPAGKVATFSPAVEWIDLLAPGQDVVSTFAPGILLTVPDEEGMSAPPYAQWSGTSFAAANVSGAIAALIAGGSSARQALLTLLDRSGPGLGRGPGDGPADIWAPSHELPG